MHRRWLLIAGLLAFAAPAAGQSGDGGDSGGSYAGVTPGSGELPAHVARARESGARLLTWPGFQMRPDGASRFFVQVSGDVETSSESGEGRFTVIVKDTKLQHRNNARPLETRHFNTPVRRAKVERRGKDLAFVLQMREGTDVTPFVRTEAGPSGFQYVFVEFPPGEYVPGATTPKGTRGGGSTSGGGGSGSSGASGSTGGSAEGSGSTNIRVHGDASGESGEGEASGSAGFSIGN